MAEDIRHYDKLLNSNLTGQRGKYYKNRDHFHQVPISYSHEDDGQRQMPGAIKMVYSETESDTREHKQALARQYQQMLDE